MSESIPAGAASASAFSCATESAAPSRNPAVQRCLHAHAQTRATELQKLSGKRFPECEADMAASLAFRAAMPDLIGTGNIRDFIACVTCGFALKILHDDEAARLLYAAQVANAANPREPRAPSRPVGRPRVTPSADSASIDEDRAFNAAPEAQPCLPEN